MPMNTAPGAAKLGMPREEPDVRAVLEAQAQSLLEQSSSPTVSSGAFRAMQQAARSLSGEFRMGWKLRWVGSFH